MSKKELLLGDEAVALAAIRAGISGAYGYPGTPSTEIFEYIAPRAEKYGIHAKWSANEKVAVEEALGMSFAGKRAIVTMKHVGLNVAADPFMNSAVTGVNGGLVVCVADDPGMHSSQNEQDSRYYAKFALLPCFEPSNQQEAYDMTIKAFELSESVGLPVVMRLVTRLAHSRADVVAGETRAQNPTMPPKDVAQFTLLPTNARVQYRSLTDKQADLEKAAVESQFNSLVLEGDRSRGIVVNGIAHNYLREAFGGVVPFPHLKICQYPVPMESLRQLIETVDEIVVVEEGYPLIEDILRGVVGIPGKAIRGKYDKTLPRTGELDPTIVATAFGKGVKSALKATLADVPGRPPKMCQGCSHIDTYALFKIATQEWGSPKMFGDIGCSTLGFYEPHHAIHSCVDMGASISMAAGAAHAGIFPSICAIGDSTFAHSGMTPLLGAASENVNMVVVILDNGTVAMTGTQDTLATGERLVEICKGLGVPGEHVRVINPTKRYQEENVKIIQEEVRHEGISVIISRRPCIQWIQRQNKK